MPWLLRRLLRRPAPRLRARRPVLRPFRGAVLNNVVLLPVLSAVILIAGALAIAYAVFRSTTVTKTVELYKGENEVQGKAIARQALQLVEQDARIAALERENEVLRNLVTGHEQLDLLVKDSKDRHAEHKAHLEVLCEIKELLGEMWRPMIKALTDEKAAPS